MSGETGARSQQSGSLLEPMLRPRGRRYAGEVFDISRRHSIQIVGAVEGAGPIALDDEFVVVDGLYHQGQFWRARIPLDGVCGIHGQAFNFSKPKTKAGEQGPELMVDYQGVPKRKIPGLNHVQSRFVFAADRMVGLYPLEGDTSGEPRERIGDIIYSIEAVGPLGVRFNMRDALMGNLISAHRLLSTQEMVFERIVVENMYVLESPELPLDAAKRRAALTASILRSHYAGMGETYYLLSCCRTNNCTSTPLREVDRIADYTPLQRLATLLYRLPLSPRLYLRLRGLDSDPSVRRLVRDEFAEFIHNPATIQRKREYVRSRTRALREARGATPRRPAQ